MNRKGKSRGQALTEFALVLPIFAILLFGIIDLGRYVYTANALANGAREGARSASVGALGRPSPDCDGVTRPQCATTIATSRSWGYPASQITVAVQCSKTGLTWTATCGAAVSNDMLRVKTTTNFTLVTPIIAQFIGSIAINGESTVGVNQ